MILSLTTDLTDLTDSGLYFRSRIKQINRMGGFIFNHGLHGFNGLAVLFLTTDYPICSNYVNPFNPFNPLFFLFFLDLYN